MVKNYSDAQLIARVKALPSFKKIPAGRWIIGIRSNEDYTDKFDDKFYEFEAEKRDDEAAILWQDYSLAFRRKRRRKRH